MAHTFWWEEETTSEKWRKNMLRWLHCYEKPKNFRLSLKLVTLALEKPARFKVDCSFTSLWKHCLNLVPWPSLGQGTRYKAPLFHSSPVFSCWWLSDSSGLVGKHPGPSFKPPSAPGHSSVFLPWLCCCARLGFCACFFTASGFPGNGVQDSCRLIHYLLGQDEAVWCSWVVEEGASLSWVTHVALGEGKKSVFFLDFPRTLKWTPVGCVYWIIYDTPAYSKYALRYLTNICKIQVRKSWERKKKNKIRDNGIDMRPIQK